MSPKPLTNITLCKMSQLLVLLRIHPPDDNNEATEYIEITLWYYALEWHSAVAASLLMPHSLSCIYDLPIRINLFRGTPLKSIRPQDTLISGGLVMALFYFVHKFVSHWFNIAFCC